MMTNSEGPLLNMTSTAHWQDRCWLLDGPFLFLDRDFTLPFLRNAYSWCGREFSKSCLLVDRLAAHLLGCSPKLSLAVFNVLKKVHHIQNTAQLNDWNSYGIMLSNLREGRKC